MYRLTGLDLLMNVVNEIDAEHADSNAFDPRLLHQVSKFKRFFQSGPFTGFRMIGTVRDVPGEVNVTRTTLENPCVYMVERLRRNGRESLVNWMELRRAATLLTGVVLR